MRRAIAIIFSVLFLDQAVKIWVKTHMKLGEEFAVFGDWFYIHFTENNGMAFGMELAGEYGKLILTLFRIVAVSGIAYYMWYTIQKKEHPGFTACIALILAGAVGNILDSVFYGQLFGPSMNQVATFMPEQGYADWLYGRVVDMLYFPVVEGFVPDWFPFWKGEYFIFFRPVFNIADSAISIGIALIFIFQGKFFPKQNKPSEAQEESQIDSAA